MDYYTKALENGKDVVSKEERLDWVLGKARALQKILRTNEKTNNLFEEESVKQFIDHIAEVISEGDDDMKEESWILLGQCLHNVRYASQQQGPNAWDDFSGQINRLFLIRCANMLTIPWSALIKLWKLT